jgi:N-acetylmuramoyl-L-alanine amidase
VLVALAVIAVLWIAVGGPAGDPLQDALPTTVPSATTATSPVGSTVPTTAVPPTAAATTAAPAPLAVPPQPEREPDPPASTMDGGFTGTGIVTVAAGGADLASAPGQRPFVRAREGLVFPAYELVGDWIRILTTCDEEAWVRSAEVAASPPAAPATIGPGFTFSDAVIVVDPGHGGPNIGTASPDGSLPEKAVNADIARRLRDLLERTITVDWDTGVLYRGDAVPAASRVILTRVGEGNAADYEAGLVFRAALANAASAHVLVSIHNNAGWEIELDHPGSDVYYQSQLEESRRFAELLVEEFQRGLGRFDVAWVGAIEWGAKSRLSPRDGESQYYGVLRRAEMPAVIAEGAYLASEPEAAVLATPEFRQAYAEAVYRALVRFLTTDESAAAPSYDPVVFAGSAGSGDPARSCEVPSQMP